jgi:EAL domain-containing protein (putative c-di-GMP-specific phosphodiesterase class I)
MTINIMCDRALLAAHDKNYKYVEYIHFYNETEHQQMMLEQEIENEMEKALEEGQFYIVVQPKYNPNTKEIVGGETLVRWLHPEKGIISPGIFIKVFEKNGFIIQLDYFVWEETCRLQAQLKQKGIKTVPISINVSRAHFYGSELLNKLTELIQKYGLDKKDIELEITESICGDDSKNIYDLIGELQKDGFKIAMDDFGSGYSSLNMLKEMPLDIIKMDLKFLDGEENKGRVILKSLIEMAQTMGLRVVVEGVEILSQVEFLSQFRDCYIQGYYFSRPVVTEVFEEMLIE